MGQNEANQLFNAGGGVVIDIYHPWRRRRCPLDSSGDCYEFSTDPHCANLGGGVHRVVVSRPKSVINLIVGGS